MADRRPSITCPVLNTGYTDMVSALDHKVENSGFGQCAGSGEPDANAESILVHPSTSLRSVYLKQILKTKTKIK